MFETFHYANLLCPLSSSQRNGFMFEKLCLA